MSIVIVWGWRDREKHEGTVFVQCNECYSNELEVISIRCWFTLFFIPIIPTSEKRYFFECDECESTYKIKEEVDIKSLMQEYESAENNISDS